MAHYDALTGLPNRALFVDRFNQVIAHSKRTKNQLAICFLDLDDFKPINDNFGHQADDEFALLINDIESISHINVLLKRVHCSLALPYSIDSQRHNITVSSGITLLPFLG